MKERIKDVIKNTAEIERMTREIENNDVLDLSKEGVYIEFTEKSVKKSYLEQIDDILADFKTFSKG